MAQIVTNFLLFYVSFWPCLIVSVLSLITFILSRTLIRTDPESTSTQALDGVLNLAWLVLALGTIHLGALRLASEVKDQDRVEEIKTEQEEECENDKDFDLVVENLDEGVLILDEASQELLYSNSFAHKFNLFTDDSMLFDFNESEHGLRSRFNRH